MLLMDALTLQPGDLIVEAGDARETRDWTRRIRGTVVDVVGNGLILVQVAGGGRARVPYHHVRRFQRRSPARHIPVKTAGEARDVERSGGARRLPAGYDPGGTRARLRAHWARLRADPAFGGSAPPKR